MRNFRLAVGAILVLAGVIWLLAKSGQFGEGTFSSFEKKWTFSDNELHSLNVRSDYPVVLSFVNSTDGNNYVHVKGHGRQRMVENVQRIALADGTLDLDLREPGRTWFDFIDLIWNRPKGEIVVSLADETQIERLNVKLSSGSLEARDVAVDTADIQLSSGSVRIHNLTADNLNLKMSSGSIKGDGIHANSNIRSSSGSINLERLSGPAKVRASSGKIKIYKDDTADLEVQASSGSVYICMPDSFAGYYDLQTSSGSIRAPESKRQTNDLVKVRASSGRINIEEQNCSN